MVVSCIPNPYPSLKVVVKATKDAHEVGTKINQVSYKNKQLNYSGLKNLDNTDHEVSLVTLVHQPNMNGCSSQRILPMKLLYGDNYGSKKTWRIGGRRQMTSI